MVEVTAEKNKGLLPILNEIKQRAQKGNNII